MKLCAVLALLIAWPGIAVAQPAIAGVVRDVTGVPRAGVTVQATSPALIEKTRITATDGRGRYRIENLRPGTYSVRFTFSGL